MMPIAVIVFLTLLPFLELRASIPYGVFETELSLLTIFIVAVVVNIVLAPVLYFLLNYAVQGVLRVPVLDRLYHKTIMRTRQRVHPYIEKYGVFGLTLFIAVPLPGSGVYSGALAAYILGFDFKDFLKAAVLGVLIAGVIVLSISVAGNSAWDIFVKSS